MAQRAVAARLDEEPSTALTRVQENPGLIFQDGEALTTVIAEIRAEASLLVIDITTKAGRDAVASLAYKIARTKTAIDAAGKQLNEGKRAEINAVDAVRRKVRADLEALQEEVRRPLTEWEKAEEEKVARVQAAFGKLGNYEALAKEPSVTPETLREGRKDLECFVPDQADFPENDWTDFLEKKESVLGLLDSWIAQKEKDRADAAELARLRAAEAEREAAAKKEAEEAAARERIAAEEKAKAEREAQAKIDEANRERDRLQREADERAAAERKAKAEQEARERDEAHKEKVRENARAALLNVGLLEGSARKVLEAIEAGLIPGVSLKF